MEVVLQVLPGVAPALVRELAAAGLLDPAGTTSATEPELADGGRQEVRLAVEPDALGRLHAVRTAVSAYVVVDSPAPRPTGLTATQVQREVRRALDAVARVRPRVRFTGLRLEAAGAHTPEMRRLAAELAATARVPEDPDDGDLLVRAPPRPLATRAWRTGRYPGALNATIAAAVVDALGPGAGERWADLMCGSGTLVIERLAAAPVAELHAYDVAPEAVALTQRHLAAARSGGVRWRGRVSVEPADVRDVVAPAAGGFDVVVANPPWGELLGDHAHNDALYADLLDAVDRVGTPDVRAGVLTHDIRRFAALLGADPRWELTGSPQFFAKGHRPRLFLLRRAGSSPAASLR